MLPPTHLAIGYLFSKTYCGALDFSCGSEPVFMSIAVISSLFPDIDLFSGKKLNDHRNTIFHAPFLYVCLAFLFLLIGFFERKMWIYTSAFAFGAFSHLFLDWFSGRTIGIRFFYPFSKKMYSLFPLTPSVGNMTLIPNKKNIPGFMRWLRFFFHNLFLTASEMLFLLIFLYFLFLN